METFLGRVENPRLIVDPPPYRQNQIFRGPLHLQVEFDRIKASEATRIGVEASEATGIGKA
jgi:hypothetical protein